MVSILVGMYVYAWKCTKIFLRRSKIQNILLFKKQFQLPQKYLSPVNMIAVHLEKRNDQKFQ